MRNGLIVNTKKENNKRTIVEAQAPKEYDEFQGSRYTKVVKTEIEDDQIKSINSDSNIFLQAQTQEDEFI